LVILHYITLLVDTLEFECLYTDGSVEDITSILPYRFKPSHLIHWMDIAVVYVLTNTDY